MSRATYLSTTYRLGKRVVIYGLLSCVFFAASMPADAQVPAPIAPGTMGPDGVYQIGNGVSQPSAIMRVNAEASELARLFRYGGIAMISVIVDQAGIPRDVRITKSLGLGLDEKAVEAAQKWRFRPAMKDGNAVAVRVTIQMDLREAPDPGRWYVRPSGFAFEAGLIPPEVTEVTMPKPVRGVSNESVVLEFTVDSSGSVKNIHSISGPQSGSELLTRHLTTWKFQPAMKGDRPVEATGTVTFIKGQGDEAIKRLVPSPPVPQDRSPAPAVNPGQVRTMVNATDGQRYVWIPPGAFTMGCSPGDSECYSNEKPPHAVQIANGFWLGQTEVTQAAYVRVTGGNPSTHQGDQLPVETLTWNNAADYCKAIGGRLPAESEWEYAARAGITWARYGTLDAVAWHPGNSGGMTHPVALKQPNAFGLYDMLGNVWEWVEDSNAGSGSNILRGGSTQAEATSARASSRWMVEPGARMYRGFRCAIESSEPEAKAPVFNTSPAGQGVATAQRTAAEQILDKVAAAYLKVTSIRLSGKTEEIQSGHGREQLIEGDYELAARGKSYYLKLKLNSVEAIAVSDGENTWKAMASLKRWSHLDAGTAAGGSEEEVGAQSTNDLYRSMAAAVFSEYPALARIARDVEIVREADYKLASGKVHCYVIRASAGRVQAELWVDKERFLVLERIQRTQTAATQRITRFKTTSVEVDQELPEATFRFQPPKDWSEMDVVLLPGEKGVSLAGNRAAGFALKTLEGELTDLTETRGKVVVLDFWATWCVPCRNELPTIEKLRTEFADSVRVYGVNNEDATTVKEFVRKNRYQMSVLMDSHQQVQRLYGVSAIPTLMILDRQGVIRKLYVGSRDEATLRKAIQAVVALK
jgi:sulfatase modifying factor 1